MRLCCRYWAKKNFNKSGDDDGSRAMYTVCLFYFLTFEGTPRENWRESGKNVNDESCSTRRALLAYQLSFKTVENPRSSMPDLLIFLTFSKFVTL